MKKNRFNFFTNSSTFILIAVTLGGALEWYEIGMFVFWQIIIQENEASFDLPIAESLNAGVIFSLVFISLAFGGARALGGWFFGNKGDLEGRKKAFPLTILFSTFPSWGLFILSFILPYDLWMTYSTVIFTAVKFFQGLPAGGEIPGAICYLAETAVTAPKISRVGQMLKLLYKCSYSLLGAQIGLALSALVCLMLRSFFSLNVLLMHGWRYVFLTTAIVGLGGYLLRYVLGETKAYSKMNSPDKPHHKITWSPIQSICSNYKKQIRFASIVSIFEIVSFSVLSILPLYYSREPFNLSAKEIIFLTLGSSLLCILFLPLIGYLSAKYFKFPWLKVSAWGTIPFSFYLWYALQNGNFLLSIFIGILLIFLFSIQAAILPSVLAALFPVEVRYTGIAFSFNIWDGIGWAFMTSISFKLISTGNLYFIFALPITAAIFLISWWWYVRRNKVIENLFC